MIRRQVAEISGDAALRRFGAVLAFTHLLVAATWARVDLGVMLAPGSEALCWPRFDDCRHWRIAAPGLIRGALLAYAACAVLAGVLFLRQRVARAWGLLGLVELFRLGVMLQDYKLRLNQHSMGIWIAAVFLFVPGKRRTLRFLIVAFYVAAGLLKLNREWLSGAALYAPPPLLPSSWIPLACAYVALLELGVAWGLLSARPRIFWSSGLQLALFAAMSLPIVGFFYPALMLCLLAFFALARAPGERPLLSGLLEGQERRSTYATLAVFSLLQLWPRLQPGDTAITGEGRWLALHMFDAKVSCIAQARVRSGDAVVDRVDLQGQLPRRIRCDPLVYFHRARALCRQMAEAGAGALSVDLGLDSKRASDADFHPVIRVNDFCRAPPHYRALGWNAWILR